MRYFIFPSQDTSLYEEFEDRNTGLDEILEVGKTNEGQSSVRSIIQFDLSAFTAPITASYDLTLYVAHATKLKRNQGIEICHMSESWDEGSGYLYQEILSSGDGASWSQSISGSSWATGSAGGSYLTSSVVSGSTAVPLVDMTFDVTTLVRAWISGSVPNNGFLIKFPSASEADTLNQGNIKFFSKDTHTIFRPALIAKWDDQSYTVGSLAAPSSSLVVNPVVKSAYRQDEVVRIEVAARPLYPVKTFANSGSVFSGNYYLPSSSYYSIKDEQSNTTIIPFGEYSKISSAGDVNYFNLRIQQMYPLRYYRVLIRVDHDGLSEIFDGNTIFTVRQ